MGERKSWGGLMLCRPALQGKEHQTRGCGKRIPIKVLSLFNDKLNNSQRYDTAKSYRIGLYAEWFSPCLKTTSKFRTIAIPKKMVTQNNIKMFKSLTVPNFVCLSATVHELS
jgi:hypothetical protein